MFAVFNLRKGTQSEVRMIRPDDSAKPEPSARASFFSEPYNFFLQIIGELEK
jgi:hypothetical protein